MTSTGNSIDTFSAGGKTRLSLFPITTKSKFPIDQNQTGEALDAGIQDPNNLTKRWEVVSDDSGAGSYEPTAFTTYGQSFWCEGGVVYAHANSDDRVKAIDHETGNVIWSSPELDAFEAVVGTPVLTSEGVLVNVETRQLYLLDETDGTIKWNYNAQRQATTQIGAGNPLTDGQNVYVLWGNGLTSVSLANGSPNYESVGGGSSGAYAVADSDHIYVANPPLNGVNIQKLLKADGSQQWSTNITGNDEGVGINIKNGVLVVVGDGTVNYIDPDTGNIDNTFTTGSSFSESVMTGRPSSDVLWGNWDGTAYRLDSNSNQVWQDGIASVNLNGGSSFTFDSDEKYYLSGSDGNVVIGDASNGNEINGMGLGQSSAFRPAIYGETVIVHDGRKSVACYETP